MSQVSNGHDAPPPGWRETGEGLLRTFEFADFGEAFAFMTRVALLAERFDHHPDWSNSWNRVEIVLISHDEGQITRRDHTMARAINALGDGASSAR